jgi:plasmid stabilization system protein ParE
LAFQVDITDPALADAEDYVRFVRDVKKEPEAAERWFRGLVEAIYSLEDLPERCPVIAEREEFSYEIRHLAYFSHRIIFRVERERNRVVVYRVYHGSRQGLTEDDLPSLQL